MSALVQDNYMHFATANYATINGSDGGGSGGGRGGMTFAEPSERVIVQVVNVSQIRADRLVAGVWGAGTDFLSRKPFQYQPLCYEKARDEHAVANCNARRPREEAEAENNDGPVVKVAMLQMKCGRRGIRQRSCPRTPRASDNVYSGGETAWGGYRRFPGAVERWVFSQLQQGSVPRC